MAVYTDVGDEALADFLTEYEIGALVSFRGIAEGVENSNYVLGTTQGDFILTLYEKRVNPAELPWFLGYMRHLADQGLNCPLPVAGRDGEALRELAGRPAAITTFLPGVWPRHVHAEHCFPLGEALAKLHLAGKGYDVMRPNGLGPQAWAPLLASCGARADEVQPGLASELDAALAALLPVWPGEGGNAPLPRGQIHADLFPDNVFYLDGKLSGLIDFYFACTDFLAYDIAICINAWCFAEDGVFRPEFATLLVDGYESVRPLTPEERAALTVLCAGASIRFLLTRLYDWLNTPPGALVVRKDPLPYLTRLRHFLAVQEAGGHGI